MSCLIPKVVHAATETLVWWHELRCLISENLTINVVAHSWRGVAVNFIRVVLWAIPREDLEEGAELGDISPCCAGEDDAPRCLTIDEVL